MRQDAVGTAVAGLLVAILMAGCTAMGPKVTTQITSTPTGASIMLDGQLLGTTPLTASIPKKPDYRGGATFSGTASNMRDAMQQIQRERQAANYIFVVQKEGYKDARKELFVNEGLPSTIHFDLQPVAAPAAK